MKNTATAVVPGSLSAISQSTGQPLAESFLAADAMILMDVSGSMASQDSRDNLSRYEVALQELAKLQRDMPGRLAVVAFSGKTELIPGGIPPFFGGGTDLAGALRFAKIADVDGMKFVVVSDGRPNDEKAALAVARTIKAPISTVYVGPENGLGRDFLERLAAANRGTFGTSTCAVELAATVKLMLAAKAGDSK
jgi:Mg-chelatase subunit ChlD